MYDHQTRSLWVHVTGQAVVGPLRGRKLEFLPSTVTRWAVWRAEHPGTKVLLGRRARGFMGDFRAARELARFGIALRGDAKRPDVLYPYALLQARGFVVDAWGDDRAVVVAFDARRATALIFAAELDGARLDLEPLPPPPRGVPPAGDEGEGAEAPLLARDRRTGDVWSLTRGECVEGPAKGRRLRQVVATPWLVDRWRDHHPEGRIYDSTPPAPRSEGEAPERRAY